MALSRLRRNLSARILPVVGLGILILSLISSSLALPTPAEALVDKSVLGGAGPYAPGQNVTIQMAVPRPQNITTSPVEIVFVVDASGSLSGAIATAKSQMSGFADWLTGYYGYAKVGLVSFGMPEDNSPGIRTHMGLTQINNATDVQNLKNAIASVNARGDGLGFSDIKRGLEQGNNLFTFGGASGRHLVLLTDGVHNYPSSGSSGYGYPWDGVCPLLPSSPRTSIGGLRYSQLIIIPQGNTWTGVPADVDWSVLSPYDPSCRPYIDTHHGGWLTGMGLIDAMIAYYPGNKVKQSNMSTTVDFLKRVITPTSVRVEDVINTSVFSGIPNAGSIVNCSTGAGVGGNNWVDGAYSGRRIISSSGYTTSIPNYCIRFTATISGSSPAGTHTINSSPYSGASWVRYYNEFGTVIASDTIELGSISIQNPITIPTNPTTGAIRCNQVPVSWTAGTGNISGYTVSLQQGSNAPVETNVGAATSYTFTGLAQNTTYTWRVRAYNSSTTTAWTSGLTFTTTACPDYSTAMGGPFAMLPGDSRVANVDITYIASRAAWEDYGANLSIRVVGINFNNSDCTMYTANAPQYLGNVNGVTARVSGNPSQASHELANPNYPYQVNFDIRSAATTSTGRYTICIGTSSSSGFVTRRERKAIHINIEKQPWIQIDRPAGFTSSMVGDVHSNAAINLPIPATEYFFKNGTAGVVTAYGSGSTNISFNGSRTTNVANKLWRIPNYSTQVKTDSFASLEALAIASQPGGGNSLPSGLPSSASINAHCAHGSAVYKHVGTLTISDPIDLSANNCAGVSLIYFIDGSLVVNAPIVDGTTDTTITYIVRSNIVVSSGVTQMDGVYIFGGSFRDGTIYNTTLNRKDSPLVINGSLIGLATQSPTTATGTFSQATYSGFQRNLSFGPTGNDTVAAERIAYQPKYLYLLRDLLGASSYTWSE